MTLDLPLESIHPQAFKAAEATHCAGDQGRFWEMHHRLFENQKALAPFDAHAAAIGIDAAKFEECMSSSRHAASVRADMAQARKAGASGTPSFILGLADPDDPSKVTGLAFIRGAQSFATFQAEIDRELEKLKPGGA